MNIYVYWNIYIYMYIGYIIEYIFKKFRKEIEPIREKMHCSNLKNWPISNLLEPEFVSGIHMIIVYGNLGNKAVIIMKNKEMYSLGENCNSFFGNCDSTLYPIKIEALCKEDVKTVACGSGHILALTTNGKVYSWSHNEKAQNKTYLSSEPTVVKIPNQKDSRGNRVIDIACGSNHFLVVMEGGEAFVWGENIYKQVGMSLNYVSEPAQVAVNERFVQIACGQNFSLVVTKDGEVYGWGSNSDGQLGKDWEKCAKIGYADPINSLPRIEKVVCGSNYALALTAKGNLYAWGGNAYGQLGISNIEKTCIPCRVRHEMGRVSDIAALHSSYISVAVGEGGRVYVWGQCRGQNILKPTLVPVSTVHDALACYASLIVMHKPLILHMDEKSSVLKCLENAFNDESTSDLTIEVEKQLIYVHKAILKVRCPYFKSMFQHDWSENNQSIIKHTHFSYNVFKAFLEYLYTGVVDLPSEEAFEFLKLADLYCENNLKQHCIQLLKKKIDIANAAILYSTAIKYNAKELEKSCSNFIFGHMMDVVKSEAFRNLNDINILKTFLDQAADAGAFRT